MLISTPNFARKSAGTLTPMMIRGAFLVWRSELQLGKQSAQIIDFGNKSTENSSNGTPEQVTAGAPDHSTTIVRKFTHRNLASWGDDLCGTLRWKEGSSLR